MGATSSSAYLARKRLHLQNTVKSHRKDVFDRFAFCLGDLERLQESDIAHASSFPLQAFDTPEFRSFGELELRVRVGHGHDLLDRIRKGIGLKTFLWRWHKEEAKGQAMSQRVSAARDRAKRNLDYSTKQYGQNWKKIQKLCEGLQVPVDDSHHSIEVLKGLKEVRNDDLRMLSDWVDDYRDYKPNRYERMPWIWKVGRYEPGRSNSHCKGIVEEWEEEGESSATSQSLYSDFDLIWAARRLEWLHAFQSLERWKEELLLLKEELLRLGSWYRHAIQTLQEQTGLIEASKTGTQAESIYSLRRHNLVMLRIEAEQLPYLCRFRV